MHTHIHTYIHTYIQRPSSRYTHAENKPHQKSVKSKSNAIRVIRDP